MPVYKLGGEGSVTVDGTALDATTITVTPNNDLKDTTVFGNAGGRSYSPGLNDTDISIESFSQASTSPGDVVAIVYTDPDGNAETFNGFTASNETNGPVAAPNSYTLTVKVSEITV